MTPDAAVKEQSRLSARRMELHPVMVSFLLLAGVLTVYAGLFYWFAVRPEEEITRKFRARTDEMALKDALLMYRRSFDEFPSTVQSLDALVRQPVDPPAKWSSLVVDIPRDPWGRAYRYERSSAGADGFRVYSLGHDRSDHSDDIEFSYPEPAAQKDWAGL